MNKSSLVLHSMNPDPPPDFRHKAVVFSRAWRRGIILFLLCLAVNLPVLLLVAQEPLRAIPAGDPPGYDELAHDLSRFGVSPPSDAATFRPEIFRTPGYPGFLALVYGLFSSSVLAVAIAQGMLHAISGAILGELTERFLDSITAGWAAGILWAVAPIPLVFSGMLFTETLFTSLLVLAVFLLLRRSVWGAMLAGFVLGVAVLVRPIGVVILPALLPAAAWNTKWRQGFIRAAGFLLAGSLALAPWVVRNWIVFGRPALAAVGGNNLLYYTAGSCLGWRTGKGWAEGQQMATAEYADYLTANGQRPGSPAEEADAMSAVAVRILLRTPLECGAYSLLDSLNSLRPGASYTVQFLFPGLLPANDLGSDLSPAASNLAEPKVLAVSVALSIFYGLIYLLACGGLFSLPRGKRLSVILFWVIPMALFFYIPGIAGNARFRIPAEPGLCLLAAWGLIQVRSGWESIVRKKR
jgi:hypothetical protein